MKPVYTYTDYRSYIRDFYLEKKKNQESFSYQNFAQKARFRTNSYLIDIINKRKALSKNSILDVAKAMDLKKRETEYFEALVHFTHARTDKQKEFYFSRIRSMAGKTSGKIVEIEQYDFYSKWYHTVIRELVTMPGFNGDFKKLARRVNPPITPGQAKASVELLLKLKMIEKTASGRYRQTDTTLHTGDEIKSFAVYQYQQENLNLAGQALDKVPAQDRDISTFTAGISESCFDTMKKEIRDFRRRMAQLAEDDRDQDRVYHMNLQFFPVSDLPGKEVKKS
jgi:uncharacterized protein (TIGR02147 family)